MKRGNLFRVTGAMIIGGSIGLIAGFALSWILGFSKESYGTVVKLLFLGIVAGLILSVVYKKQEKIVNYRKETYAWVGGIIGAILSVTPIFINSFGYLSGALLYFPILVIEKLITLPNRSVYNIDVAKYYFKNFFRNIR